MILYHGTWGVNLKTIREKGLIPNYHPNWWPSGGLMRSKEAVYLCEDWRRAYWEEQLYDSGCWVPDLKSYIDKGKVVWLRILVTDLKIEKDSAPGENYDGDWLFRGIIEPWRISVPLNALGKLSSLEE